ncbi:MAG: GNAT family N-acetyltransferase [Synechococcales cyanobacterium T60_A2020_003]|nr:GNAT family N-acetyltransferase [Synechococcales cyanobacterium T60_A2020_003]
MSASRQSRQNRLFTPPLLPSPAQPRSPYCWESSDRPSDMFPFLIRTARPHDLRDLSDLLADSFYKPDGQASWLFPLFRLGIYEDLRHRFHEQAPHYACLAAVDYSTRLNLQATLGISDIVVGTIELSAKTPKFWNMRTEPYLYISNLAVRPTHRRQGIALKMLTACEQIALDWGFSEIYLHVLETNKDARKLYKKAGYQAESIDTGIGSILFGKPRQLFLRKTLTSQS